MSTKLRVARTVEVRFVRQGEEERTFDRNFWQRLGPQARLAALWDMVLEAETLKGRDGGQLRLQRSVLRLQRR